MSDKLSSIVEEDDVAVALAEECGRRAFFLLSCVLLDTIQQVRHMMPVEDELDPEDDEDILDPVGEPDCVGGTDED